MLKRVFYYCTSISYWCTTTKVWHPQNDILNGIDLKIHASSLAHRSACGYSITDFSHDFSNQKYASWVTSRDASRDEIGFADATRLSKSSSVEWWKWCDGFDGVDGYISSVQTKPGEHPIFVKIFCLIVKSEMSKNVWSFNINNHLFWQT